MLNRMIAAGAFVAAGLVPAAANATVLYDNIGLPSAGVDAASQNYPLLDSFSTGSQAVTVAGASLLVDAVNPGDGGLFLVGLVGDNSGSPSPVPLAFGAVLDSALSATLGVVYASFNAPVTLAPNTRYWFGIDLPPGGASSVQWSYSSNDAGVGVAGEFWFNTELGVRPNSEGPFQAQLTGVVPEPSTWAMLLVGFAGLGFAAYRRPTGKAATASVGA